MTAPVIEQPDAEAWVWANVGHLKGVTSFAYTAQVTWPNWVYAHWLQIDCRARRKTAARDLAEHVRRLMQALPEVPWDDGTVSYVQPVEGPFWLPDDDGCPRYCTRYEVRVHPRRATATEPPHGLGTPAVA